MSDLVMFRKTSLTGGGATAVDGISATALVGNELCFTTVSDVGYLYRMNATSGAAADGVNIIIPVVGTVGDKRWILEGVKFTSAVATALAALTTPAESWVGPSSTAGIYFKDGFVGIGKAPGAELDVVGVIRGNSTYGFTNGSLNGVRRIQYGTDEASSFTFLTDGDAYAGLYALSATLTGAFGCNGVAAGTKSDHIADATGAADVITRVNAILVVLEKFGFVATS